MHLAILPRFLFRPAVLIVAVIAIALMASFLAETPVLHPAAAPSEPATEPVRSTLFPQDWTPSFTDAEGRYLPDFSYAGYRYGEEPPATIKGVAESVLKHGADPQGEMDSTAAFQAAIDAVQAQGGGTVEVPKGLFKLTGNIEVTASNVLLCGAGPSASLLHFTRHDGMTGGAHLRFRGSVKGGEAVQLAVDATDRDMEILLRDASSLKPGDDITIGCIITDDFIARHGMTGTWKAFNGTWQVFLQRTVVGLNRAVEPHRVLLDAPVRYPLRVRDGASVKVLTGYISDVGLSDIGIANAVGWAEAWSQPRVHAIRFDGVKDGWIRRVSSFASPSAPPTGAGAGAHLQNGGILVASSKRVTVAECDMRLAQNRGSGGCGYLFEIMQSCEVLTRDCSGVAGRHNFIQNWGFGTAGCVWLRCHTAGGVAVVSSLLPGIGGTGYSEYHHSLASANLVDSCTVHDGWSAVNRKDWSSGAGHTATQCVFWNTTGTGVLRSAQFGWGYIIGTEGVNVNSNLASRDQRGTDPPDWQELVGRAALLCPGSLYEAQRTLRIRQK